MPSPIFPPPLYNVATSMGGQWQPSYWYAPDGSVSANTASWVLNPFNSQTYISNVYQVNTTNFLDISLTNTPPNFTDACGSQYYISGTVHTQPTFRQLYGYFEANIAISTIQGVYYTFSLQTDIQNPPQIDIANIVSLQNTDYWFNQSGVWDVSTASLPTNSSYLTTYDEIFQNYDVTQFHTYGVDWQPDGTFFYIDRILVFQLPPQVGYTVPMFPVLGINCGTDGFWSGPITNPNILPATMQIGYVKVWLRKPF